MKRDTTIALAAVILLALVSLACGGSGAVSAAVDCPDGMEAVQVGTLYHGYVFEVGSQVHARNTVEGSHNRCGTGMGGIPNHTHAVCTLDGWINVWWDGQSNSHVCAKWKPDHVIVTPGPSTGDAYILSGDGCPDSFTFVHDGGSYGGCTFEVGSIYLKVYCNGEFNRDITTYESGPVWRSDSEPSERGLQVFWPGGNFSCAKER